MISRKNNTINSLLLLIITTVFLTPYLSSCGKSGNASSVGLNVQLEVLNLSPNILPVDLYLEYVKQNTNSYSYPFSSGYFYLNSIDTPLQIKSASTLSTNNVFFTINHLGFQSNHKYSLYILGSYNITTSLNTLQSIITLDDTTPTPAVGFGKIRFINGSLQNTGINVTANGTAAFTNIQFAGISPYITLPAGNYVFQLSQTANPGVSLSTTLGTTTIQDGHLYTMYSYGVPLHVDSSAFNAAIVTNR